MVVSCVRESTGFAKKGRGGSEGLSRGLVRHAVHGGRSSLQQAREGWIGDGPRGRSAVYSACSRDLPGLLCHADWGARCPVMADRERIPEVGDDIEASP